MRSKALTFLTAITVVGTSFTATAVAAPADGCSPNYVCLYEHADFSGHSIVFEAPREVPFDLVTLVCPGCVSSKHPASNGRWNDQMSSWINNSGTTYCWFFDEDYGVEGHVMNTYSAVRRLPDRENDEASSLGPC
ncbi:peptidase inhibitor family I36 protein [Amycolatopsis sp. CA-230715]|uniref:peptidase inhibitor family I36 protein n=1 Tax=Amycolatopsis sp. CA-230715 TaxID=2745196 RepID=UPI001C02F17D|nr:peptidase inhibitor family I36 protein [Amycolatopsis sp. CA-230715]QWF84036.1 hypothetical protein HUW46_07480 [Amycolatopsis sp. CA-230715]